MFPLQIDRLKRKTSDLFAEAMNKTRQLAKETSRAASSVMDKAEEAVAELKDDSKEWGKALNGRFEHVGEKIKEQIEQLKSSKHMRHKVLMLGGRRAGKSTILASILASLKNTPGTICTISDKTDYPLLVETPDGIEALPSLEIKQNEVRDYIKKRGTNVVFTVDMTPSKWKASYVLEVSSGKAVIELEFVDVPGEWMRATKPDHAALIKEVESSDIFVIAIDTPYLMNEGDEDGVINKVYNRISEISQLMLRMQVANEADRKQIILCPVKCEKWVRNHKTDELIGRILAAYRDLINRWVMRPEVTIQIMPIQTVGGIEFVRLLPALLYFKDDADPTGVSCSQDSNTGMYINREGNILRDTPTSRVEEDKSWSIDYTDIPLSWYKLNGAGYAPVYCEQVGYHILRFLVEKEENVNKMKAKLEADKLRDMSRFRRWFTKKFKPMFGEYLPVWRDVIDRLYTSNLIKETGDGFMVVKNKVD